MSFLIEFNTFILDSERQSAWFLRTACRITPNSYCLYLRHGLGRFCKDFALHAGLLGLEQRVLVRLKFVGGCIFVVSCHAMF